MSYQTAAYDDPTDDGQPVVVLVARGSHDVSRLINLLTSGRHPTCEQVALGAHILKQVKRHNGGRAALRLLKAHGGPDLLEPVGEAQP